MAAPPPPDRAVTSQEAEVPADAVARISEPTAVGREEALAALRQAYRGVTDVLTDRTDSDYLRPTRFAGWGVSDVLYHLLLDARRALVALATPTDAGPDVDYISYWRSHTRSTREAPVATRYERFVRVAAAAYADPRAIAAEWRDTSEAALRAASAVPADARLATRGKVLSLADLLATLSIEATLRHLDLTIGLPAAAHPGDRALALTRRTLDGLLGAGVARPRWTDLEYILKGAGRSLLTDDERVILGPAVAAFPLLT